nr:G protein-coupled receptor [Proales similis]
MENGGSVSIDALLSLNSPDKLELLERTIDSRNRILATVHKCLIATSCLVIFMSSVFNTLSFVTFYRMKKRSSQNVYLSALSLAELINTYVNVALPLVIQLEYFDKAFVNLQRLQLAFWTLYGYLVEVALLLHVWIMVLLALERSISIAFPLATNVLKQQPRKSLAVLVSIILVWSLFKLHSAGLETYSSFRSMGNQQFYRNITMPMLVNISTMMWCIVPELLTLLLNLLIIRQVNLSAQLRGKFYSDSHNKRVTQATRVAVSLSVAFVCLVSPLGISIIADMLLNYGKSDPNHLNLFAVVRIMDVMITRKLCLMFYELQLVINFPVYLFTIRNFKESLLHLLPSVSLLNRKDSTKIGQSNKRRELPHRPVPLVLVDRSEHRRLLADRLVLNARLHNAASLHNSQGELL